MADDRLKRSLFLAPLLVLIGTSLLSADVARAEESPSAPPPAKSSASKTATVSPAGRSALPVGVRYFQAQPFLVGIVQTSAIASFLGMMTGPQKDADASDAMTGVFQLLKDQIDGPLSVAAYADPAGKSPTLVMVARLKQADLTRELLDGALSLGGDEKGGAKKTTYRNQTLLTMDLSQATGAANSSLSLQPTFTITDTNFLLVGTTQPSVEGALDAEAAGTSGLEKRADVAAMMREFPLTPATDVWLFVPKPSGKLPQVGKSPLPLPLDALPFGPMVVTMRFTPSGLRFEGLAAVDRSKTAQAGP